MVLLNIRNKFTEVSTQIISGDDFLSEHSFAMLASVWTGNLKPHTYWALSIIEPLINNTSSKNIFYSFKMSALAYRNIWFKLIFYEMLPPCLREDNKKKFPSEWINTAD